MTDKGYELENLIGKIHDMNDNRFYANDRGWTETQHWARIEEWYEENRQTLVKIRELLESGEVDLSYKTNNHRSIMDLAVVKNNVELVELLISFGVSVHPEGRSMIGPLHRAAEFGADRVVKFLIEEKGLNPRASKTNNPVLSVASSSPFSRNVVPYLVEVMKKTMSERLPAPKKLEALTEVNMLKWLPQISIPARYSEKLHSIVESLFIEGHSVPLPYFYETIESQDPELVFACIPLITQAITTEPKDKVIKKVSGNSYVHHGNLEVTDSIKIKSLLVTGNLTVKGKASNVQGCRLFVGGNFECESMYTEGPVVIGGNLKAREVEAYYNDYALDVKQTLQADKLIIDRHQVTAGHFDVKERIEK